MARILMTLLGLLMLALGIWLGMQWSGLVLAMLKGLLLIVLVLVGLVLLIFGISEIAGAAKKTSGKG